MLTEIIEYGHKIEEEVKAMQSKIKENIQGANSEGKETGLKASNWNKRKKETSIQKERKKQEFKKMKRDLQTSRTT